VARLHARPEGGILLVSDLPMNLQDEESLLKPAAALAILVAYEDTVTRDHALRICDALVTRLGQDIDFSFSWWKFNLLCDASLAAAAADFAAHSDMVIVSAHVGGDLPAAVTTWIEAWAARRCVEAGALVAMIGVMGEAIAGLTSRYDYLKKIAEQTGMDYLPQALVGVPSAEHELSERAGEGASSIQEILRRQPEPRHWGINE